MKRWVKAYYVWFRIWLANYQFPLAQRYRAWRDRHYVRGFGDALSGTGSAPDSLYAHREYMEGYAEGVVFKAELADYSKYISLQENE